MLRTIVLYSLPLLLLAKDPFSGFITDSKGTPIPYVFIHDVNQDIWVVSDENGKFSLSSFIIGDTLKIFRIGYVPAQIQLQTNIHIKLEPDPVDLKPVNIISPQSESSYQQDMVRISKISSSGNIEHRQILEGVPGISIRSYGGPAGITTLSLDGGPSSNSKIIFSGFDLTNAQNGIMDISQLPTPFVEEVTFTPYEGSLYGSGSTDGVIHLNKWKDEINFTFSRGSYGHQAISGTLPLHYSKWRGSILLGMRHDDGDYPVNWRNRYFNRRNNKFDQKFAAASITSVLTKQMFLRMLYLQSLQNRGVAGQVWSPDSQAYRDDILQLTGLTLGWVNKKGHGSLQLMERKSNEDYIDFNPNINSHHKLMTRQIQLKQNYSLATSFELLSQFETRREVIKSSNTESHSRTSANGTITISTKITSFLEFRPTIRYDMSPKLYSENTYEMSFIFLANFKLLRNISLHHGKTFRYPTFNDLYWEPGGNPDLNPEHSKNTSMLLHFHLPIPGNLKLLFYRRSSKDLIQWTPSLNYWQPKNIQKAIREGWKMTWQWFINSMNLKGFINYSLTHTENQTPGDYFGKPLTYAPVKNAVAAINWNPSFWSFHFQAHHTSDRITMYSWPTDVILPSVTVLTASVAFTYKHSLGNIVFVFAIDNIADKSYETVLGFPEPRRTFRLTLTYEK